jgi:hypothetical protein
MITGTYNYLSFLPLCPIPIDERIHPLFIHCHLLINQNCVKTIKKNEMGGVCSTYGGEERCVQGLGGET